MYVLVSYDISDDRRRLEIMNKLKSMGYVRVQRSLYIARGGNALAKDTARALTRLMNREDSVVILIIDGQTLNNAIKLGTANLAIPNEPTVI
ncbi:CRISPR-associated endonuclease Cas2 [Vulcanisaeta distributa]|uniref:CRISPR-associated endoribonuclease Cas2 n=1 Tax=Vulcanisaeta distributa (strain DSM 14429 / JCM 11212 / NBRC 100878 / IC-017) TaxID=572478 RepID=E1QU78_VULDI|nr:CRISPR-associated endonuclease Cas2 [Vulcanisaeta distributa]ADN51072.1 CRISPR-associated protein Cas2 [Vulcanisaeta distributa DSM 14429]